jgi:hypothetical protein
MAITLPNALRGSRAFLIVRWLVGLLLLTAAGLKIHALATDPLSQDSLLLSPRLQIATIQVEIVLGLWLLSGWAVRAAWLASIGFFVILAGSSLYLALDGQPSCGCFGRVTVNPWWTFALDAAVVAVLAVCSPPLSSQTIPGARLRGVLTTVLGAAAILALVGGAFLLFSGDPATALARLRGEPITVEPSVSWVGERPAQDEDTFTIQLTNHGDQAVQVFGGTANCSCIATGDLPMSIPPHESRQISVNVMFKGQPGLFERRFILYVDNRNQPIVLARFAGRVLPAASP